MIDIKLFIKQEFIFLLLLLIFFLNLYEKGFYMCFILAFYLITTRFSSFVYSLDKLGVILVLFSLTYTLFYIINTDDRSSIILAYTIAPITFYGIGKYFSTKYRSYNVYFFLFVFISLGYSILPAVSIFYQVIQNGFTGERDIRLLTRVEKSGATLLGSYFTMNMAAIGTIFVRNEKRLVKGIKFISLGAFIISLICVFRIASRTQLIIASTSIVVTVLYLMFKQSFSKNIRLLFMVAIILTVTLVNVSSDSPFLNVLNQRNNSEESLMGANGRADLWAESLKNLTTKPFGWKMGGYASYISEYSHNLWLDVDRVAGIIPFIFLSLFTLLCIALIIKTLKIAPLQLYFNITVLVWFIGFMAVFFVEPVIEGIFALFLIFCLFIGILSGFVKADLFNKNRLRECRHNNFKYKDENFNHII